MKLVSRAVAMMLGVASCGSDSDNAANPLLGKWTTPCTMGDSAAGYQTESFEFLADGTFNAEVVAHATAACAATDAMYAQSFSGAYVLPSAKPPTGSAVDFTLSHVWMQPKQAELAAMLSGFCGVSTWTQNTKVEITNKPCDFGDGMPVTLSAGDKRYEIYKIEAGKLSLGEDADFVKGNAPVARATVFDTKDVFSKVAP